MEKKDTAVGDSSAASEPFGAIPMLTGEALVGPHLLLRHRLQIYGFWTLLILAVGILLGLLYASHQNKKFFETTIQTRCFYYVGKDGKGRVYDVEERPTPIAVAKPPAPTQ